MSISDLLNLVELLNEAKIPNILVICGILFLFVAIGGQFEAIIETGRLKPVFAGSIGLLFLFCGVPLFVVPLITVNKNPEKDSTLTESPELIQGTNEVASANSASPSVTATELLPIHQLPSATPSSSATPRLVPPDSFESVQFCGGCTSSTLTIDLAHGTSRGYVLRIFAGQTLHVSTDQPAVVKILGADGSFLPLGTSDDTRWEAFIPQTSDYKVIIDGNGSYVLTFHIPPIESK